MLRPPRIGIPVPTSFDQPYNDQSWPEYAQAVKVCGGEPVRVELRQTRKQQQELAETCAAFLLPGSGADVSPERYGHDRQPETAPTDEFREEMDRLLLEHLEVEQKPLLAICFGLQSLNVFRGGTLIQHLQPLPVNHRAGRSVVSAHAALVVGSSRLGEAVRAELSLDAMQEATEYQRLMVNSSHHQAVGTPGEGLRIVARSAEDGVIEGVEDDRRAWLLGVQWHPERTLQQSAASRAIFAAFVRAAEQETR